MSPNDTIDAVGARFRTCGPDSSRIVGLKCQCEWTEDATASVRCLDHLTPSGRRAKTDNGVHRDAISRDPMCTWVADIVDGPLGGPYKTRTLACARSDSVCLEEECLFCLEFVNLWVGNIRASGGIFGEGE